MNDETKRPTDFVTPAQVAVVKRLLAGGTFGRKPVDRAVGKTSVAAMNLRHLRTKLSRLNLTEATREAAALKAQFRREDEELYRQGRGAEVLADRMKNLGMTESGRTEVLTINGVRIKP